MSTQVPAILIQKSTLLPVNNAMYPREDMSPFLEGEIDPDYFWLIKNTPFPEPSYDPRIYIIEDVFPIGEELLNCPPHPVYPQHKAYNHTYRLEKRPNEEIILAIENAKKDANNSLVTEAQHKDEFVFMMAAVNKKAEGFDLTEIEQQSSDKLANLSVKLARNDSEKASKIAMVVAGLIPNIEEGWERSL